MDKKNIKILISVVLFIAAAGIAYLLSYSNWKESNNIDGQISQTKTSIATSESYYTDIDTKVKALNDAGWATKKASILINFDKSLWFTSKINNFFKAIVPMSGMKLVSMTSSSSGSGGEKTETPAVKTESGTKTEGEASTKETTAKVSGLKGSVKTITINLTVTGTYLAFKNLLSQFQQQTRIVTIKSIAVSSGGQSSMGGEVGGEAKSKVQPVGSSDLSFSIIANVYSY